MKHKIKKEKKVLPDEQESDKHQFTVNTSNSVKVKKEEDSITDSITTIQVPVKKEFMTSYLKERVKTHVSRLHDALKDDEEFFHILMDKILLVGHGYYYSNVFSFIHNRYKEELESDDDLDEATNHDNKTATIILKRKILTMAHVVMDLLIGGEDEDLKEKIETLSKDDVEIAYRTLHNEVTNEICHIIGTDDIY